MKLKLFLVPELIVIVVPGCQGIFNGSREKVI